MDKSNKYLIEIIGIVGYSHAYLIREADDEDKEKELYIRSDLHEAMKLKSELEERINGD